MKIFVTYRRLFIDGKPIPAGTEIGVKPDRSGCAVYCREQFQGIITREQLSEAAIRSIPVMELRSLSAVEFKVVDSKEFGFDVAVRTHDGRKIRVGLGAESTQGAVQARRCLQHLATRKIWGSHA